MKGGSHQLREDPFAEAMARWEASIRALNAEVCADPFEAGMNHEAEARAATASPVRAGTRRANRTWRREKTSNKNPNQRGQP